jgi:signal transduction histidine kinase/DNA-binding response OmpR family regulator
LNTTLEILLVEDNPGDAYLLRHLLPDTESVRYEFNCVTRVSEAIACLKEKETDLVLLDLGLPDSDGIGTVTALRGASSDIPIVVLTGTDDEKIGIAAVQAGAQDFLVKGKIPVSHLARVMQYAVERHRSQKKLRESEQFLRSALDGLSAHIAIVDDTGVILTVNKAWREFSVKNGAGTEKTGPGNNYLAVCDSAGEENAEDAAAFAAGIRAVLAGREPVFEMVYPCHSPHKPRWFNGCVTPFPADGPARVVVAHENITKRKLAQKALIESKNKVQSIVDNIGIGVALIGPDMEVLEINQQIRDWFPGAPLKLPFHCYDAFGLLYGSEACEDCPAKRTLADGKIHRAIRETRGEKKNRTYRIVTSPLRNDEGRIQAAIQMMEDITESVSVEKKLRQAQKLESLGTLAGGIAHDFNNILSAILGFTELALDKTPKPGPLEDNLREIHRAGIRAVELVRQILTFSRKTEPPVRGPLRIDLILKEALKLLRATLPTTIEINLSIEKNRDCVIAEPTQIHQIIMNLCTNASHAMGPEGGVLSINLEQVVLDRQFTEKNPGLIPGPYLKLSVSDTGCGMTPEIIESIFDPYFTTKDLGEGTGLGLSLVLGIVRECGGDIFVESTPGKGTIFTLYFPSVKEADVKNRLPEEAPVPVGRERILVVDDEAPILKLLQRSLEQLGYHITTEQDGARALALIQNTTEAFDLVISDMTMPKITGSQLAAKLKVLYPDLPFILCTGYSKLMTEEKIAEMGISALLIKPVSIRKLAETVRRALDAAKKKA